MACPPFDDVDCATMDENMEIFDFSPLTLSDSNYQVSVGPGQLVGLNLCRSLVRTPLFGCPYKSAICLSSKDKDGSDTYTNLGQINSGPYLDEHNRLVIHYTNGEGCQNSNETEAHFSAKIIFK